jgi:hypothetical protein
VVPLQAEPEAFGPADHLGRDLWLDCTGEARAESDVDLLIVGPVSLQDLLPALRPVERQFGRQFGREANVTRYSEEEFRATRRSGNSFLNSILKSNLIMMAGSPGELEKTAGRTQSSRAQSEQEGIRRVASGQRP